MSRMGESVVPVTKEAPYPVLCFLSICIQDSGKYLLVAGMGQGHTGAGAWISE